MVLAEKEKAGAINVLKLLGNDEVFSLARTITKNQIRIASVEEAVRAIIAYTDSPAELLRRRKVCREALFRYTHQENIGARPTDDKITLIQRILVHWNSRSVPVAYLAVDDDNCNNSVVPVPTTPNFHSSPPHSAPRPELNSVPAVRTPQQQSDYSCWNDRSLRSTDEDQQMAFQFATWFYARLNRASVAPSEFGAEHFFRDAVLLLLVARGSQSADRFEGCDLVSQRLAALIADERLIFNPNVSAEGIRGMSDPHGRRVIAVCGTVHRSDTVLGLFEQQFGLVRDPTAENNWKIRTTRLLVSTSVPTSQPTLTMTQAITDH